MDFVTVPARRMDEY